MLEQVLACTALLLLLLLLSRGLGAFAAVVGGEELAFDLLGFFQMRELTKLEKLFFPQKEQCQ